MKGFHARPQAETGGAPERTALVVLLALVVGSPWMFGGTPSGVTAVLTRVALATSLAATLGVAACGRKVSLHRALLPGWAFVILGAAQLLPFLPRTLHTALAPASAHMWYPSEPAAAQVLGPGPHPISIHPARTRQGLALIAGVLALAGLAGPALAARQMASASTLIVGGAAVVMALYSLMARLKFGSRLYGVFAVPTVAPFGPFVSKNHFAGYVEMTSLLLLGIAVGWASVAGPRAARMAWIGSKRAGPVMLAGGAAAALALSVLVTQSRGGTVSLASGALAFLALGATPHRPWTKRRMLLGAALAGLMGAAFLVTVPRSARDRIMGLPGAAEESAGAFRLRIWGDALRLAAASPIVGSGLGTFADALPPFKSASGELRVENAENDYVQVLAETGALGLVLVVLGLVILARELVGGLRNQENRLLRGLGRGALAGLAALVVHSAFDFNLRIPSNALLASFLVALGCGVLGRTPAGRRFAPTPVALGLVAVLGLAIAGDSRPRPGQPFQYSHPASLRLIVAEAELVDRLQKRPADAEAWVALGWHRAARGATLEGAALARYGATLDPRREALQAAATSVAAGGKRP